MDYQIGALNHVDISIHNMKGEKVAVLQYGEQEAGTYSLTWNASGMESGIYFLRMLVGSAVETQKLLLVK